MPVINGWDETASFISSNTISIPCCVQQQPQQHFPTAPFCLRSMPTRRHSRWRSSASTRFSNASIVPLPFPRPIGGVMADKLSSFLQLSQLNPRKKNWISAWRLWQELEFFTAMDSYSFAFTGPSWPTQVRGFLSQFTDAFSAFSKHIAPTYRHDRCER